jgi:UDP-N-acetylmuramoyl-L-alanyl-D-glutamate--2,6-diaminopimelate ligase
MQEKRLFPTQYRVACHTDHVGPGSTFVAIKGMKLDGTEFIEEAVTRGATRIVIEEGMELSDELRRKIDGKGATLMVVPSSRLALAELSAEAYDYPANSLKIIAITGTKGKTTTAYLVEHILKAAGYKTALISTVEKRILDHSFAGELTTPQPDYLQVFFDQCRTKGVEFVVMEAAAQAFSLHRLATLTFDAVAFTNFSLEHSEFYASQDDYFKAKCQIFKQMASLDTQPSPRLRRAGNSLDLARHSIYATAAMSGGGRVVLNADDQRVASCASMVKNPVFISIDGNKASLSVRVVQSDLSALKLEIQSGDRHYGCSSKALLGQFSAYNVATAIALVEPYAISPEIIQNAVASFQGVPGRLKRYDLPNKAVAFIDNAHTPSSFEAILSALRPLSPDLTVIFGAGGDRDAIKRPIMGAVAAQYANNVFLTTDNPRSEDPATIIDQIKVGIGAEQLNKVQVILDREEAIKKAYALSKPGTIIALLGKGPVEYQHIKSVKIPFSEAAILRELA